MARGSNVVGVLAAVLLIGFLVMSGPPLAGAATYMVGDYGGWTFKTARWAKGKTFHVGDVLVFNYNRAVHDVAIVDAAAYGSCRVPRGAKTLRSGRDKVTLSKAGTHYFLCTKRGHCKEDMKIAVRVVQ